MALENIVRPFQLPNSAPPQQYITARQPSRPPIILYFGRSGSGRTFTETFSSQTTFYMDQKVKEVSKK